jgi:hypothetical protein
MSDPIGERIRPVQFQERPNNDFYAPLFENRETFPFSGGNNHPRYAAADSNDFANGQLQII